MVRFWIAVAIHNAIQCYLAINAETKELLPRNKWVTFFKKVDRIESGKEPEFCHQRQMWVKLCFSLLLLLLTFSSTISHLPSSPSSNQWLFLPVHLMPILLYCTTVLFQYCSIRLKMFSLFFAFYVCITCLKSIINLLQYSTR